MVGLQLARHWKTDSSWRLVTLGSGPEAPREGYVRLAARDKPLVDLGELAYARFCRDFERETTDWILERASEYKPEETSVVVNDISEGPTLSRLDDAGYSILSIWHVDVVDYFNKLYLRRLVEPERLTRLYERLRGTVGEWILPDVLNLVFEKQRETVARSKRIVVPSRAMADTISRCYSNLPGAENLAERIRVIPWGVWSTPAQDADQNRVEELRDFHAITPETFVLITLSRISPEKGIHLLLEALRIMELNGRIGGRDVRLFICGEPAFMMGQTYFRKVKAAAARLKQVKVAFPGYLDAGGKRAYMGLADLFVSPSIHESYGLNVVEAMQAGLPILANDHYGVRDVLPADAGRIVKSTSQRKIPANFAFALEDLMKTRVKLKSMGEAAAKAARAMPFSAAAAAVRDAALGLLL